MCLSAWTSIQCQGTYCFLSSQHIPVLLPSELVVAQKQNFHPAFSYTSLRINQQQGPRKPLANLLSSLVCSCTTFAVAVKSSQTHPETAPSLQLSQLRSRHNLAPGWHIQASSPYFTPISPLCHPLFMLSAHDHCTKLSAIAHHARCCRSSLSS